MVINLNMAKARKLDNPQEQCPLCLCRRSACHVQFPSMLFFC